MTEIYTGVPEFVIIGETYSYFEDIVGQYYKPDDLNILCVWQGFNEANEEIDKTIYEYHGKYVLETKESNEGATFTEEGDFEHWNIDFYCEYTEIQLINP
jgi:hypothetical protein